MVTLDADLNNGVEILRNRVYYHFKNILIIEIQLAEYWYRTIKIFLGLCSHLSNLLVTSNVL